MVFQKVFSTKTNLSADTNFSADSPCRRKEGKIEVVDDRSCQPGCKRVCTNFNECIMHRKAKRCQNSSDQSHQIYMTECTRISVEIVTHVPLRCIGWITILLWRAPLRLILQMRTSLCTDTKAAHAQPLINSRIVSDARRFWQFERISA